VFLALVSKPHPHPFGYRLDTYQVWPTCDGEHEITPKRLFGCVNPGIVITVNPDDDPEQPFVASLGPWELMRSDDLAHLYDLTVDTLAPAVMTASIHLHFLGYPCHECCECDELDDVESDTDEHLEQ
jgi:hypothetical protein